MCKSDIKEAGRLFSASLLVSTKTNMQFMVRMLETTENILSAHKDESTTVDNQLRLTRSLLRKVQSLLTK